MDLDISLLEQLFGHFPEPVFYLINDKEIFYSNKAGRPLLPSLAEAYPPELAALWEHRNGEAVCTLSAGRYLVTASNYGDGLVLVCRLLTEKSLDVKLQVYSIVPYLRDRLSSLSAASEYLCSTLRCSEAGSDWGKPLSILSQNIHRLLHLVRHLELSESLTEDDPALTPVDLTDLCKNFVDEITALAKTSGIHFTADLPDEPLLIIGREPLLRHMLLELLSNAMKAVGREGHVGLRLALIQNRAVFTVWDDGPGIREDRMPNLFDAELPTRLPFPGEGTGLGLFLARRIATLHDGVIMAENRPEGGATLVVSLPKPKQIPLRAPVVSPSIDLEKRSGFSPALVGLSDALPWQAFPPSSDS